MSDLTPAVTIVDGQPMTTSLDVAEKFEKKHQHVLEAIRKLLEDLDEDFGRSNFRQTFYTDSQGREQVCYKLTRDAFSLLAMGFTGKAALAWKVKYIEAFNGMEAELLKLAQGKKAVGGKQTSLPAKDKYLAYIEEVEAFRASTMKGIDRLTDRGLDLMEVGKFGPGPLIPFNEILMRWLMRVVVYPSALFDTGWRNVEYAVKHSPIGLVRELEKMLPVRRN